ncbi:MAG: MFS transporter, partial [Thermoproteales archaeon]|nr:MFS transporter [Thermoproteales archaeon]
MRSLKIIVTMWIVYASFYLCRVNYSVALPYINSETGITFTSLGVIASGFFILYSIGQVLNGYLGVKYNPWIIMFIGIVGSSISTILFGLSNHFTFFLILWLINGYFQSTGWPSLVKIISFTLSGREMGKGYGIVNTSWALGHVISWLFTGILATYYGWRFGFIINGFIFLLIGMIPAVHLFRFTGDLVIVGTTGKGFPKHKELDGLFSLKWSVAAISILSLVYS